VEDREARTGRPGWRTGRPEQGGQGRGQVGQDREARVEMPVFL